MITNLNLLQGLTEAELATLKNRAEAHSRFSSIDFKIIEANATTIYIRVTQDKSHAGNYFDNKRLAEIGKELFEGIGEWKINCRPFPYKPHPTDVVTAKWIDDKINSKGIKLKDLSIDLGIDANTLSAYRRGLKNLTAPVKAAFYYYFKS